MKKLGLFLLAVAIGVTYWYFIMNPPDEGAPVLTQALHDTTTASALGVEDLHEGAAALLQLIDKLPEGMKAEVPAELTPAKIQARFGFDPATAEGWRSVGVDPEAGFTLGFDATLHQGGEPRPVLLVKALDLNKALKALGRATKKEITKGEVVGGSALYTVGDRRILVGQRNGQTAVYPLRTQTDAKAAHGAFNAFLTSEAKPLADYSFFTRATEERGGGPWLYFNSWAAMEAAKAITGQKLLGDDIEFYAARFPAAAVHQRGARILADAKALKALRELFSPPKPAPKFSRFIPAEGWGAVRFTLNLKQMFTGLGDLFPPSKEVEKGKLLFSANMLPMLLGVSFADLEAAFSGHFVVATAIPEIKGGVAPKPDMKQVLVLLGAGEPKRTDAVLKTLLEGAKNKLPTLKLEPLTIKGAAGYHLSAAPDEVYIVRAEDTLLAATDKGVIEAALSLSKPLSGEGAERLDGDYFLSAAIDTNALLKLAEAAGEKLPEALIKAQLPEGRFTLGLSLDAQGVQLSNDNMLSIVGLAGAVGVPSFIKFKRKSKDAEAFMNLERIAHGARFYYDNAKPGPDGAARPKAFPPSAGPTPAKLCEGGAQRIAPDPKRWEAPGWEALGFKIDEASFFQYRFESKGEGKDATFTATATTREDCKGAPRVFEIKGEVRDNGGVSITKVEAK